MKARRTVALVAVGSVALLVATGIAVSIQGDATDADGGEQSTPTSTTSTAAPRPPGGPDALLPNMRSLRAFDLQIEGAGGRRLLRFAAALANLGPGPLMVTPHGRVDCPRGQIMTRQHLYRDGDGDGIYTRGVDRHARTRPAGCMLDHPTHDHWHFDSMAAYSLRHPDQVEPLVARPKVSFCLRDNRRVRGVPSTVRREFFGDCAAESPQGISPGWVDVYSADLDGQSLRVPRGVDGDLLCLDLVADPRGRLVETDETDNAASMAVRIRGTRVRRVESDMCRPLVTQ